MLLSYQYAENVKRFHLVCQYHFTVKNGGVNKMRFSKIQIKFLKVIF